MSTLACMDTLAWTVQHIRENIMTVLGNIITKLNYIACTNAPSIMDHKLSSKFHVHVIYIYGELNTPINYDTENTQQKYTCK